MGAWGRWGWGRNVRLPWGRGGDQAERNRSTPTLPVRFGGAETSRDQRPSDGMVLFSRIEGTQAATAYQCIGPERRAGRRGERRFAIFSKSV